MNSIFIISFIFSTLLIFIFSKILNKVSFGQSIRKLGPKKHFIKEGTPNIGGVFIIIITTIITLIFGISLKEYKITFMLIMPIISYGVLGFLDDYKKSKERKNDGLTPKTKMIFQILWAVIYFFIFLDDYNTIINVFGLEINLYWIYGLFILLCFVSTSNAFNLCDGIDGLAGGIAIIILFGLLHISNNKMISIFIVSLIGSILAFLVFNFHPAKIFMGDSGSLALGVTIANLCILLKVEILLLIFGFLMIIETLSVIIQVLYYKKTNKRVFLMTPIHHHFELKGYKEPKITIIFWIFQIIFVIIGIHLYEIYY